MLDIFIVGSIDNNYLQQRKILMNFPALFSLSFIDVFDNKEQDLVISFHSNGSMKVWLQQQQHNCPRTFSALLLMDCLDRAQNMAMLVMLMVWMKVAMIPVIG